MEKQRLGKTDIFISPITFGAWAIGGWMWGGTDDRNALKAMRASYEHGVTSIDTAPVYGLGHSEKMVGKFVKEIGRDNIEILTKFGLTWKIQKGEAMMEGAEPGGKSRKIFSYAGKDDIMMEVEDSLKRLNTDYIDLYQIHRPDYGTPMEEIVEMCLQLQKQGKIRAFGVSNHSVDLMKRAEKIMNVASTQSPYSMVYRKIEEDIIPHCLEKGIAVLAYSPLQRGLLTGKIKSGHSFPEGDHRVDNRFFREPNLTRTNMFLDKIRPIADTYGVSLSQLVINWTKGRPGITSALVGARDARQAKENAKSLDFTLSDTEIQQINEALEKVVIE